MFESPRLSTSLRSIRLARGGGSGRDRSNSDASASAALMVDDSNANDNDVADIILKQLEQQQQQQQQYGLVVADDDNTTTTSITPKELLLVHHHPQQHDHHGGGSKNKNHHYKSQQEQEVNEACVLFTIVGVGYLFPFSALTQPIDYWNLLFPDFNMEFPLTTIYMWTNLILLAVLVFFYGEGEQGSTPHFTRRIVGGFVGQLLVLVAVPTFYFFHWDEHPANVMAILGSTAVAAIVTAFIDSSVIALVAQYPLRVQEYFQLGVGVSTLIGSIYRDVTKLVFPPNAIVESSLLYFYTGAATIGVCIVAYYRLLQLPLSQQCLAKAEAVAEEEFHHHQHHQHHHHPHHHPPSAPTEVSPLVPKTPPFTTSSSSSSSSSFMEPDRYHVLRKIWFNECMVLLLFLSTLALWPPLVTEIPAYYYYYYYGGGGAISTTITTTQQGGGADAAASSGWWPLILLTIFSCSDCVGRLLVRFRMGWNKDNIWMAVALRFLVLFPLIIGQVQGWWLLFLFTTTTTDDDATAAAVDEPDYYNYLWLLDVWSALLVGLLGMTNGYVGTLCIVLVNDCLETSHEQAIAGTFTSFFLNSGLVLGATFGLLFDTLVSSKK